MSYCYYDESALVCYKLHTITNYLFSVVQPAPHQCLSSGHVVIPSPHGYLSSTVTQETQCGSPETPYLIRLNAGQKLNVTLIDFDVPTTSTGGHAGQTNAFGNPGDLSASMDVASHRGSSGCIR